jgi:hypothetical protein
MNRHKRRKLAVQRKQAKLVHLANRLAYERQQQVTTANLSDARRPERSPRGLGNRGIYQGVGMFPAKGYGEGFKHDPTCMTDWEASGFRNRIAKRQAKLDK